MAGRRDILAWEPCNGGVQRDGPSALCTRLGPNKSRWAGLIAPADPVAIGNGLGPERLPGAARIDHGADEDLEPHESSVAGIGHGKSGHGVMGFDDDAELKIGKLPTQRRAQGRGARDRSGLGRARQFRPAA